MKLKQLLTAIKYRAEQVPDVDITDLVYDSRKAVPGCAFVCLRGANADGHKYAKTAAEKGAAVIIAEEIVEAPVPVILTDNTRLALAYLSAEFFGHPAEQMHVIGITGTKGKTTTAFMMRSILEADEGSRRLGEVALVPYDSPISNQKILFYNTLFDENAACHIAFGDSYPGTTVGGTGLTREQLDARGMNHSSLHEDVMIGAEDSEITGKCRDGRTVELFRDGVWVL